MRLIYADKGYEVLDRLFAAIQKNNYATTQKMLDEVWKEWCAIPTAYDVDKVVKRLESILEDVNMQLELSKDFQPKESESVKSNIVFFAEKKRMCEELIKIVKSGGIE